jgi:anti-anti-sigma factor
MIRVRQVDDVAIIDWSHKDVATVVPRIRSLVDAATSSDGGAKRLLLNMREVETLKGEGLETLTEALSVCEDKGCTLAMFGLNTYLTQLVDIMGLHEVMPTIVGAEESEALTRVRTLEPGAPREVAIRAEEIEFDPVDSDASPRPAATPAQAARAPRGSASDDVEFEFEEPARPRGPKTVKFDRLDLTTKAAASDQSDEDLLGVSWGDLVAQGLAIGGPDAAGIVARVKSEATAPTRSLGSAKDTATRATPKVPEEAETIEHKTAIIPAFSIGSDVRSAADQLADSAEEEPEEEEENLEVEFEPSASSGERPVSPLFGGADQESSEFSPVDEPPAKAPAPAARTPSARLQQQVTPPPTPRPATPRPATARPAQPAAQQAQRPAAAPPPARTAPPGAPAATGGMDQGDETVMFQPDGLLAEVLAAVAPTQPEPGSPATPPKATSRPAAETAPAVVTRGGGAAPARSENGLDELKKFLGDYALVSELHLRVLDKFSREGVEKVLGRPEVQSAVGGSAAAISSILEDFVQARLLRRRRSPRIRGGTGFLYSPSPRTRNAVIRLLRRYEDGTTRAEVMSWVSAVRKANER